MSNSHKGISRKSKRKELALKRFPIKAESRIPFTDGIKNEFRTPRVNSIFSLIADLASVSELKKIGQPDKIDECSRLIVRTRLLAAALQVFVDLATAGSNQIKGDWRLF